MGGADNVAAHRINMDNRILAMPIMVHRAKNMRTMVKMSTAVLCF